MSARDVIFAAVIIFVISISLFTLHYMLSATVSDLVAQKTINESQPTKDVFNSLTTNLSARFDYIVFGLFIGLVLGILITGWFVGGYPIFMFIYFIVIIIGTAISAVLANAWANVTASSVFGTTIASFSYANHIISNLPVYIAVIGFLGMVVMFSKPYIVQNG